MSKKNNKKKKQNRKKVKRIIIIVVVFIITAICYFFALNHLSGFQAYSDENTDTYKGTVTSVYTKSHYTGYKNRKRTIVYIELDGEKEFSILHLTLRENDYDYESLKDIILNKAVEIKAGNDATNIVSLDCEDNSILTINDSNKNVQSNVIGLTIVFIIAATFVSLILIL
ncbi:MAG: hypothetical protein E7678_02155 [Ruminococcaceae bacterium]|nr:hypothetical protein [Oscillospiraceae bacterium]